MASHTDENSCTFCAKPQREVMAMVTGDHAAICDECVLGCIDILAGDEQPLVNPRLLGDPEYRAVIEQRAASLSRVTTQILEALRRAAPGR